MQDGPASISIKTGPRSPRGLDEKSFEIASKAGSIFGANSWLNWMIKKRYTGFAALEMPLPDVNAGDATRSNDGPTSVGPPLFGRAIRNRDCPRCPNAPGDRTLRTGPQPCKQKGRIERPFFCCAMGARHAWLAVNGWMCSITLVLLDGPLPRPWFHGVTADYAARWRWGLARRGVTLPTWSVAAVASDLFAFRRTGQLELISMAAGRAARRRRPSAIVKFHGGQS
jgi:hypothetical protein